MGETARAAALPFLLGALSLGLYFRTMARTITWEHGGSDGAELAAAAYVLGVPHPSGYPLFVLLGHLFTWLPAGEIAFRVGLLSVITGAVSVGIAASLAGRLSADHARPRVLACLGAAVGLATAPLHWSQATIVEVYTLHGAIVLSALWVVTRWRPRRDGVLAALGLLLGLGLGNHLTLGLLVGPILLYVLAQDRGILRRGRGLAALGTFLLGLLIYAYLPLRASADPPLNWGNPSDPAALIGHVTASSYWGYVGGRPAPDVLGRVPAAARLVGEQLTWPGLALAFLGLAELAGRQPAFARMLLGYLAITVAFALLYNAEGGQVHLLPLVLVLAVGMGLGAGGLASGRQWPIVAALVVALGAWQLWSHVATLDLSGDKQAATYARAALDGAPAGTTIFTEQDQETFALWYTQIVERRGEKVVVVDRRLLGVEWYRAKLEREHPGFLAQIKLRPLDIEP